MLKFGLKIWSTSSKAIFEETVDLVKIKKVDFVEIYIVPGADLRTLEILRKVPATIHCPHSSHGFDVFKFDDKIVKMFKKEVVKAADFFGSEFIVVHPGFGADCNIFEKNIAKIYDKRIIIENLPKFTGKFESFGHSLEQLKFIKGLGFDICFDFIHAVKSAISQKIDYKKFINEVISELNPFYFHLTSANLETEQDEHLDLFSGEFDIRWAKEKLFSLAEKKNIFLVFEAPKIGDNLENDIKNINYFRELG